MVDILSPFIVKYQIMEHYINSAKYKMFVEKKSTHYNNEIEYKKIPIKDAIDTFPNLVVELDYKSKGEDIFYEFKVLFSPKLSELVTNLNECIQLHKPKEISLKEFLNEIDKKIHQDTCNWNVYASK